MAPKKREAAGAAGSAKKSKPNDFNEQLNKDYFAELGMAVNHVLGLKQFKDMRGSESLSVGKGGSAQAFDLPTYKKAMAQAGKYSCAGVLAWVNEMWTPLAGVPNNMSRVKILAADNYKSPDSSSEDDTFSIAVENATWNPMNHLGALRLAEPCEPLHAMWIAAYRDLADVKAKNHDQLASAWATRFRKVTFSFSVFASDLDIHHAIENRRESLVSKGAVVASGGLQKVMKVIKYKERYEASTAQ